MQENSKLSHIGAMAIYMTDEIAENQTLDVAINTVTETVTQMPSGDLGAAFAKMIVSLIAVVALLFLTLWFIRKFMQTRLQKGGASASIHILEKRMLSPKTMLYLVEVDRKKILLTESHLEIKRLESFDIHRN